MTRNPGSRVVRFASLVPGFLIVATIVAPGLGLPVSIPPAVPVEHVDSYQPDRPIVGTFIYLWQKNERVDGVWRYWDDGTTPERRPPLDWNSRYLPDLDPSIFDPAAELYSGQDPVAQRWIVEQLVRARQDVAISSWWGPGHRTDVALGPFMDLIEGKDGLAPLVRVAIYYELEGPRDPSPAQIDEHLRYVRDHYAIRPSYLRIGGRPVVFVYGLDGDGLDMPARWEVAHRLGFYTVLRVFGYGRYRFASAQPDAWHDYRPAVRIVATRDAISVSPGFYAKWERSPRLRRNPRSFVRETRTALVFAERHGQDFVLFTTGNEDGEGTGYFPQTPVLDVGSARIAAPDAPPSDGEVSALERALPPVPRVTVPILGAAEQARSKNGPEASDR